MAPEKETIEGLSKDVQHLAEGLKDIKGDTKRIFEKLDGIATVPVKIDNVEEKIDNHISGHWKIYPIVLGVVSLIITIILTILKVK
jgi:hypothetical protein